MSIVEGCDGKWATSTAYSWILLEGRTGREWRIWLPREVQGRVWEDKYKEVIRKKNGGQSNRRVGRRLRLAVFSKRWRGEVTGNGKTSR